MRMRISTSTGDDMPVYTPDPESRSECKIEYRIDYLSACGMASSRAEPGSQAPVFSQAVPLEVLTRGVLAQGVQPIMPLP